MGRPINKKFFGNLNNEQFGNVGTGSGIGGEGIASINWSNLGSWLATAGGAAAPLAGLALPAPKIPTGVQATWTNYFGIQAVTTGAGKTGLVVGDTYTYAGYPGSVITVASTSGTNATFTVTTRGSSTALLTDLQTVSITKVTGTGAAATFTVDIFSQLVNTVIGEPGSGYDGTETFTVTLANGATGTPPAGTLVLTSTTQNAIEGTAYLLAKDGGSSAVTYDIVKQEASHRYLVKTAQGIGQCKLVAAAPSAGQMTIIATAANGSTYYVTKLTAHKVILVYKTGTRLFADNAAAGWTLGAASTGVVSIASA